MLEEPVILRTTTLVHLIRRTGAEAHTTLSKGATWYNREALRALDEAVVRELTAAGLAGSRGIHPDLLATVDAIARPNLEYYAWCGGPHEGELLNQTILAGPGRDAAFIVARNTDTDACVLACVPGPELLDNFLAQLPAYPPARGQQVVAPKSAAGKRDPFGEDFRLLQTSTPDAGQRAKRELDRVLRLERLGGAQLYVAARGRDGARQRIDKPIVYIDTPEGRWLTEEVPGHGETQYVCSPATPHLVRQRLHSARGTLAID